VKIRLSAVTLIVLAFAGAALTACGGDDETSATTSTPVLRSSPIPSVEPVASPTAVCDPPAQATLPANFPTDVPVPPEYKVDGVETTPHLRVLGRALPPPAGVAYALVFEELHRRMIATGWDTSRASRVDGARIDFNWEEDGRAGFFHAIPVEGCVQEVHLIYEFFWITP
jgi:hypothetical protein